MLLSNLPYAAPLLSLALLWTVAVVTPGPNFFNTAQLAASCSRRHGVVASAGVATGTVMWGLAGGLGIKSLFTAAPMLYMAFKIIGGCYLIYLGLKLFKRSAPAMSQSVLPDEARRSLFSAWRLGLLGAVTLRLIIRWPTGSFMVTQTLNSGSHKKSSNTQIATALPT